MKYLDIRYPEKNIEKHRIFTKKFTEWVHKRFFNKPGKLLDVGCGKGLYMDGFSAIGFKAYGIDKEKYRKDIKRINLEKEKIPFTKNFFDYVFSKGVIHHIENTENFLKEIKRVLKPNGMIFIMTMNWETTYKFFYEDFTVKKPFTLKSLKNILTYYGFEIIEARKFQNVPYFWRYTIKSFDFIYPNSKSIFVVAKRE